ncbi:RNA-directed RNA polymerase [ssRNA phage Zoerhiza.4_5]|uniref:RNA-directed RNA polymerase n=2 Tax=Leviviricetes TaxID=2842243 RepID=A0A8S5KY57_9VIRU|nr:RNA-directed RNA polymerase [ssRNA phage Zoerhiza.4_5]QDH88611.1 MAG: RNA-dependent RNA polymerase [Leviviridae sp.]DAD50055.1 TPA_asm: RNA-directed RNA polymerase [ssRNA phage Zoerhiza.4_5]
MKSLVNLLQYILLDMEDRCHVSTIRDLKTVSDRIKDEGQSFLTITLPAFGSDFTKSLDQGFVAPSSFAGFRRKGGLPVFLRGFLELVFDRDTGRLLPCPDVDAIFAIRQITLMFAKIRFDVSERRNRAAISKYMEVEDELRSNSYSEGTTGPRGVPEMGTLPWGISYGAFRRVASMLFGRVLLAMDESIYHERILPRHGPGSTADRLLGNKKFYQTVWPDRLEVVFPAGKYAFANWRDYLDRGIVFIDPGAETPVRVITVPKTQKTPRIIAIEPTAMQYMQQGLLEAIVEAIEGDFIANSLIGFKSQVPNQQLALKGSLDGSLATLDLSEASDRVSYRHVRELLSRNGLFAEAVDATRSRKADVPGHGVIRLAKFASMGSALCFPMEAMVFCTVVFLGIEQTLNRRLTMKDVKSLLGKVRVYGDDIIVPVEFTDTVVDALEAFGFRVNTGKSFWNGKFRESCGRDYYDGVDITTIRLRSLPPTRQWSEEESEIVISSFSFRNQAYKAGLWKTVRYMDSLMESLKWPTPAVHETSPGLGRVSHLPYVPHGAKVKWDPNLQKPVILALTVTEKRQRNSVDGYPALLKWFLKRDDLPFVDVDHLLYSGRPRSVDIKLRWVDPH